MDQNAAGENCQSRSECHRGVHLSNCLAISVGAAVHQMDLSRAQLFPPWQVHLMLCEVALDTDIRVGLRQLCCLVLEDSGFIWRTVYCNTSLDALIYFIATLPDRGWQRNEGLLLLHSFLSLDILVAFSILRFGTSV